MLYIVLRPENYGTTPNGLDPFFYSGYAINLDDLLSGSGTHWYFVSRWSVYLPAHLATRIAGPFAGRLLLRLVLVTVVLLALWAWGRRWQWTTSQNLFVGTLVVTMPMFVRGVFTDYTEYVVVTIGLCLTCLAMKRQQTLGSAVLLGVMSGLLLVANPFTVTMLVVPLVVAVISGAMSWRRRFVVAFWIVMACGATIAFGAWFFEWRYGIADLYQPTIDFIRHNPGRDPLKSPRLEWLAKFTWIYMPPIGIVGTVVIARARMVRLGRAEFTVLAMCAAQYAIQWIDQFVRDGNGLEISYYWIYAYPTLALVIAMCAGMLTGGASRAVLAAVGVTWLALLAFGVPDWLRLPGGVWFGLVAVAALALAVVVAGRSAVLALCVLVGLLGWCQFGAPPYDPFAYHPYNMSPKYDQLFRRAGDLSERLYAEAVWFSSEMDKVPHDELTSFLPAYNWSNSIVGIYAPHVVERVIDPRSTPTQAVVRALHARTPGAPLIIAVLGTRADVASAVAGLLSVASLGPPILDVTHGSAMRSRLVVFEVAGSSFLPFSWTGDVLGKQELGITRPVVHVDAAAAIGPAVLPPQLYLPTGDYVVTLAVASGASADSLVGRFSATSSLGAEAEAPLSGTSGRRVQVSLNFHVPSGGGYWTFSVERSAKVAMDIASITLELAPD